MLKLVRLALTAAIVTAIAVRLRRRARTPGAEPAPAEPAPVRRTWLILVWAAIAAIVALVLAVALIPTEAQEADAARWRASQAEQQGIDAGVRADTLPEPLRTRTADTPPEPLRTRTSPAPQPVVPAACVRTGPVRVRPVSPRVRAAVDRQWRRVERWLKANAPRTYATLGEPGRATTIAVAEAQMGVAFSDDLRASLLRHNGMAGPPEDRFTLGVLAEPRDVRGIRDRWRGNCAERGTSGEGIPFADAYEIEPDGGAVVWPDVSAEPLWPSYYAMLRDVAGALETGGTAGGRRPEARDGRLEWVE
ncbi:hypothetical protein [Nonomuraea sp. NPDC002799]